MKLRAAVITDNLKLAQWQLDALEVADEELDVVCILNCLNTKIHRNIIKNFIYYLISFFSLKNKKTKSIDYKVENAEVISFESGYIKNWQTIPNKVINQLLKNNVEVVIKFGMNLVKIDETLDELNVISFHHGNPSKYRGRPAGFYEILHGEKKSGVIVQKISNKLDAGKIYAFAESKVIDFSYKKTSLNFYGISQYLLKTAIVNLNSNAEIDLSKNGPNYRLPSNFIAIYFIFKVACNLLKKILYGMFMEKIWRVAIFEDDLRFEGQEVISSKSLTQVPMKDGYNFYADPFFSTDGKHIRLEALGKNSGVGDILEVSTQNLAEQKVLLTGNHFSYPFSFAYNNVEYLLPEVANHSHQYALKINGDDNHIILKGLEDKRLIDSTLYFHSGFWYLFFGLASNSHSVLNLWVSDDLRNSFTAHPCSPISISPSSARMGGSIAVINKRLIRFGQNNEGEYGRSLSVNHITELSPKNYSEYSCGSIKMDSSFGPHSLNIYLNKIVIDYYDNEFSFFAGIRRIKNYYFYKSS